MRSIKTIVRNVLNEEIKRQLNEGFRSNKMRQFFRQHGGVKRVYTHEEFGGKPGDVRYALQDALGDIYDDDIVYTQEFDNEKSALNRAWELNHPVGRNGSRQPFNSETYYTVYKANDGTCLLVGLNEKTVPTYPTWGGHYSKKKANRYWNNGEKMRYKDDSDTYYYGKKAKSFGVRTNKDFKYRKEFNNGLRSKMSPEGFQDYINKGVQSKREYIRNNFPPYNF